MNPYCQLAKEAIKNYLATGEIIEPPKDLPEIFYKQRSGVFVTIERNGELRGCIGTYLPTKENIAKEIIANAVSAATQDYRFNPVTPPELNNLTFTVSLLSEPELIDSFDKLDPKKYGLIVKCVDSPGRCGLLLPDLEGIDTAEQQFSICCAKGEIDPEEDTVALFRFKVEKYSDKI
jgi:AmmeMemoRadiSam system protein A